MQTNMQKHAKANTCKSEGVHPDQAAQGPRLFVVYSQLDESEGDDREMRVNRCEVDPISRFASWRHFGCTSKFAGDTFPRA